MVESRDAQAAGDGVNLHAPAVGVREVIEVAVVDEDLALEIERRGALHEAIFDVGGVGAVLHPEALFELGVL